MRPRNAFRKLHETLLGKAFQDLEMPPRSSFDLAAFRGDQHDFFLKVARGFPRRAELR